MGEQDFRSRYLMKVGITKRDELGRAEPDAGGAQPRATDTSALGGARAHEADEGGAEVAAGAASKTSPPALRRRATDDFRLAYIQKLTASRAFIPHLSRPKSAQTVTIFDWDDTLMATTHVELVMQHFGGIPSSTKEQLKPLDRVSAALLALAETSGKVVIITNATDGWVQHSAGLCMPLVKELIASRGIEVISARGAYERAFPGDCHAWKVHAFLQVQRTLCFEAVTNLVSIGDSVIEMDAVHVIGSCFAHALVKTVKLWERPTPHELVKQLEVVLGKLPEIFSSGSALNIWMERDQKLPDGNGGGGDGDGGVKPSAPKPPASTGVHHISSRPSQASGSVEK